MKKFVSVLLMLLFFGPCLQAQPAEKLTNSTIVKMVKAKLSDDLIIGEITSSEVNFDLSADAINYLTSENVSSRILQAMKVALDTQISTTPVESIPPTNPVEPEKHAVSNPETSSQPAIIQANELQAKPEVEQISTPKEEVVVPPVVIPLTETVKQQNDNSMEESTIHLDAISYVIPMEGLMLFFNNEFNSLNAVIQKWDQRIRNSLETGKQIKDNIREVEKEFTEKKNADSRAFNSEIILLKGKLNKLRESNKQWNNNMFIDCTNITKELKSIGNNMDQSIDEKFSGVSRLVSTSNPDPSMRENSKALEITRQKITNTIVNYVSPSTELLIYCQNEMIAIQDIIALWNEKALAIIEKDSELNNQLEPLKKELTNYQLTPRNYKAEISGLKKQCSLIEKDRKLLNKKMENDSKELAKYLNQMCKEVQSSVKERNSDIIENINYAFQDNLSGFKNSKE